MVLTFDNDEEAYLRWIEAHTDGYVANVDRAATMPQYPMVHTARHRVISSAEIGGFTTGAYIKHCSDSLDALLAFCQKTYDREPTLCRQCT